MEKSRGVPEDGNPILSCTQVSAGHRSRSDTIWEWRNRWAEGGEASQGSGGVNGEVY